MASKPNNDSNSGEYRKNSKVDTSNLQEIRMVVDNAEAGCIIGKGGSNVQRIRSETGGFISILKNEIPSAKERVMVLKGTVSANAQAVHLIAQLLIDAEKSRSPNQEHTDTCIVNVLIHKFLAGCIIGKRGSIIKELKESSGAHVRLSNEVLPGSTEKTVEISGSADVVHAAALSVFTQLSNNPLKPGSTTTLYIPGVSMYPGAIGGFGQSPQSSFGGRYPGGLIGGTSPGMYGAPLGHSSGGYGSPLNSPSGGYGLPAPHGGYGPPHGISHGGYGSSHGPHGGFSPHGASMGYGGNPGYGGASHYGGPSSYGGHVDAQKVEKIVIPTVCAGIVIGKGGSAISEIKKQSNCYISIAMPEPNAPEDRVVTITGTKHGIHTAIYLIRQRVEAYQPRE